MAKTFIAGKNWLHLLVEIVSTHCIMLRGQNFLLVLFLLTILSCKKDDVIAPKVDETKYYLHLSHIRTNSNSLMVAEVENIDFGRFDMLWLGGDLAFLTSADEMTMNRLDSLFNFGNTNTLWALGNHDYTDLDRVEQYTNRPSYYSIHQNGITFVVLDTQDSLSNIVGAQKEYLMGVLDTIQESTHLILLHHKLIWMYGNPLLEPQMASVSNGPLGACFFCVNPNNFNSEIYPELIKVKSRGVEVICVAGDIGSKTDEFEHTTDDGIYLLASGIDYKITNNKALLFHHNLENNSLSWTFRLLSDL